MNNVDPSSQDAPDFAGLAPVLARLGKHGGPLFELAARPAILIVTTILAAIGGKSFRVETPTKARVRTNPQLILEGSERNGAAKFIQALLLPVQEVMHDLMDRSGRTASSRRLLARELLQHQDGIAAMEEKLTRLNQPDHRSYSVPDVDKELKAEALRLGLRHHTLEKLRQHAAGLRLLLHQMIVTPGLEISDLNAWHDHSIDGHVLELVTESGMIERLLGLHPRHLARLADFRRESCNDEGVFARRGMVGSFSRLSSLWLVTPAEAQALYRNPRLRQHRLTEPFIFTNLETAMDSQATEANLATAVAEFAPHWRAAITRLLSARLHGALVHLTLDQAAMDSLSDLMCQSTHVEDTGFLEKVALPFVVTIAAVNACAKIEQFSPKTTGIISSSDVDAAILLARPAIVKTVEMKQGPMSLAPAAPISTSLESVLAKLSAKGPLTKRELIRSFHKMKVGDLDTLLQRGIAGGLLVMSAGKYSLRTCMLQ